MKTGFQLCCLGCNACQVRCSISGGSTCICVEVFRAGFIIILFPGYWFDSEYRGHQDDPFDRTSQLNGLMDGAAKSCLDERSTRQQDQQQQKIAGEQ